MTSPDVLGSGGRAADPAPEKVPALPTGRNIELVLLAFAAAIVTAALVLVEANQENELTRALLYVGAAYLGLFTVAHFAVRKLAPYADPVMLPCVALLNGLGLVMIHRLDLAAADRAVALGRDGADGADPAAGGVDGDRPRAASSACSTSCATTAPSPATATPPASPGSSSSHCPACCRRRSPRSTARGSGCGSASSRSSPASSRRSS